MQPVSEGGTVIMAGKFNMAPNKVPMPERDPKERARCFQEVAMGYTPEQAREEATRCLHCKAKPCVSGCPVGVPIPDFIAAVAAGDFLQAYDIIRTTNSLPAVCGRVCPRASTSAARRANRLQSVVWNASWQTTPESMAIPASRKQQSPTVSGLPLSAAVRLV